MFDNSKLDYAFIRFFDKKIEGVCSHWEISKDGTYIKMIIDGKEYLIAISNVLLTERGNSTAW